MFIFGEAFAGLLEWDFNTVVCEVEPKTLKYKETQLKNEPFKSV